MPRFFSPCTRTGPARPRRFFLGVAAVLAAISSASVARADVSSWFYAGGGMSSLSPTPGSTSRPGTFQMELGMGSPPDGAVVVGGLAKMLTFFSHGSDLALVTRGASGGFVRGGFGLAIDAGAYQRWWGQDSTGFIGSIVLGAPLGIQIAGVTEQGSNQVKVYGATVGIDFLRLTVYRTTLQSFCSNPFLPAHTDGSR